MNVIFAIAVTALCFCLCVVYIQRRTIQELRLRLHDSEDWIDPVSLVALDAENVVR